MKYPHPTLELVFQSQSIGKDFPQLMLAMSNFMKWAELPPRDDIYQDKGTTKWGNHDLYPIVPSERTYGRGAFLLYWVSCSRKWS
jgi:hypothetical protein